MTYFTFGGIGTKKDFCLSHPHISFGIALTHNIYIQIVEFCRNIYFCMVSAISARGIKPLEEDIFFTSAGVSSNTNLPSSSSAKQSTNSSKVSSSQRKPNLAGLDKLNSRKVNDSDSDDWEDMDGMLYILCCLIFSIVISSLQIQIQIQIQIQNVFIVLL